MTHSEAPTKIRFNAFDMNCVAHQSPGLWRHPEDRSRQYNTIEYWTDLAKLLEKGLFDGLFIADVLGVYDVFGGGDTSALLEGAQTPVNDPLLLVSAMAAVTEHLGFGVTAGTGFEHPFPFARRLSTLDHLTRGRVGWNVVTGYLPSAARNLGHDDQLAHDSRYDHADEYLEVLYKLLEGSWEDDAVIADPETGVYADAEKVHHIGHFGKHFQVPGIHVSEPSPQRTPVLYQAGTSSRGVKFAAENAEAVFISAPSRRVGRGRVAAIRAALDDAGRGADSAKIFQLVTIITAETDAAAHAKLAQYREYSSKRGALTLMSGWMGIDLAGYELSERIGDVRSNAIQSAVASFREADDNDREWTVGDIAEYAGVGGLGPIIVGSGATVADQLQAWVSETGVDGFNLAYAITPGSVADFIEHVVPVLQARGVYQTEYAPGTLRQKLFGRGDRLPAEHRGARYRPGGDLSTNIPRAQAYPNARQPQEATA